MKVNDFSQKNSFQSRERVNSEYKNLYTAYQDIIDSLNNGDFKNSLTRYITELNLVTELKNTADENNLHSEYEKWCSEENRVRKILFDEFHVEFDD